MRRKNRDRGGGLAQLGERDNGIVEATGSNPVSSTIPRRCAFVDGRMAKTASIFLALLLLTGGYAGAQADPTHPQKRSDAAPTQSKAAPSPDLATGVKAALIPAREMIDGGLHTSLQRRIDLAKKAGCQVLFIEIDTYGGALNAAFDICDLLSSVSGAKTVAYVPAKAISAGALIAVSCKEIVMGPDSTLGDCEPIIPTAEQGMMTAPEKTQTVLRARFRSLAEKNGYPSLLAEAMVTKEMEVYQVVIGEKSEYMTKEELDILSEKEKDRITRKKLIVGKDRLLTMTARETKDLGFAREIVDNREALYKLYGVSASAVTVLETNWSEEMVRFLDMISPILLTIGLVAIYIELKAPGFGLPGIVAICCFATFFLSKYLIGLAEHWEVLLFVAGVAFVIVEIFVLPGFAVPGLIGLFLIAVALFLSFQPFVIPANPLEVHMTEVNLLKLLSSVTVSIVGVCVLARYLPQTPIAGRIVLKAAQSPEAGYVVQSAELQHLVGQKGVSISPLRPAGRAQIGEDVFSVVTRGEMLEKDRRVEVIEVKGNRIVVRES